MVDNKEIPNTNLVLIKSKSPEDRLITKVAFECSILYFRRATEGKLYMEKQLGRTISMPTYYRYLETLDSEPELQSWLQDQARIGFVKNQRDMIEETILLKQKATKELDKELSKADDEETRNNQYIVALMHMINEYNKRLGELNLGNPVIATIKYMIDNSNKPKQRLEVATKSSH